MDSASNPDLISTLEDVFLAVIISCLPFKEAVKTSVLSQRWRNVYLKMSDVSFKESEFLKRSVANDEAARRDARVLLVQMMIIWITRSSGKVIESLEICLSNPVGFEAEITSVIEFVVSKGVKNLVLNFSDPSWSSINEAKGEENRFQLPECVYSSTKLESLKLFFCGFNPSRFANPRSLKSLSFGWTQLQNIMALISKCPLLDSLSMTYCWNVGPVAITGDNNRLRELIYKNCEFIEGYSTLDVPSIKIFKYAGTLHYFQFMAVNRSMKEVELDFEAETEYDNDSGILLSSLLYNLLSARKVTVCPYLIQLIQQSDDPVKLQAPMETKHVVMKTNMQPSEFAGIRFMINSCPRLQRLIFVMVPARHVLPTPAGVQLESYWTIPIRHECMKKTLRVVEVHDFTGTFYEVHVLAYLIKYCRVLEKMELHAMEGLDSRQKMLARAAADMLGRHYDRGSTRLRIFVFNA